MGSHSRCCYPLSHLPSHYHSFLKQFTFVDLSPVFQTLGTDLPCPVRFIVHWAYVVMGAVQVAVEPGGQCTHLPSTAACMVSWGGDCLSPGISSGGTRHMLAQVLLHALLLLFLEAHRVSGRVALYTQHPGHEGTSYHSRDTPKPCR